MSKGSEALEKLCEMATYLGGNDIEIRASNYNYCILRELKALEIIKERQIDVFYIAMFPNSLEKYNKHVSFTGKDKWCLTQEEFDLLKEVLL